MLILVTLPAKTCQCKDISDENVQQASAKPRSRAHDLSSLAKLKQRLGHASRILARRHHCLIAFEVSHVMYVKHMLKASMGCPCNGLAARCATCGNPPEVRMKHPAMHHDKLHLRARLVSHVLSRSGPAMST